MIMMTKANHTFLGFSWHILFADVAVINITFQVIFTDVFADVAVINITFQVIFTDDIFFGVIHKALIRMGVNFLHGNLWKKVFLSMSMT